MSVPGTTPQTSGTPSSPVLSEQEFRKLYEAKLRERYEALQQERARSANDASANAVGNINVVNNPPGDAADAAANRRRQRHAQWMDWFTNASGFLLKICLIAGLFANGSIMRFAMIVGILLGIKLVGYAAKFFSFTVVHQPTEQQVPPEPGSPPDTAARRQQYSLFQKTTYVSVKLVTTFFISLFPTWRVEKLEAEVRRDGVMNIE